MADDLKAQIDVELNAEGVVAGANQAKEAINGIGTAVDGLGATLNAKLPELDNSFKRTAQSMSREEKTFAQAITRATNDFVRLNAELETGAKNTAAFFEAQAQARGLDVSKFSLQLDVLEKQNQAYRDQKFRIDEARAALEENYATQKKIADLQRQKDNFVENLRRQAETAGLAGTELLKYQAAIVGAEKEAAQYITSIERTNAVIAEQADQLKLLNQARQAQAAQQRAGESYLASLRDELQQITLTRNEYRLLRAEQLGVAKEAQVLITAIDRQNGQLAENEARVRALAQAEREAAAAKAKAIQDREAFIASLKREAEAIGKTRAELLAKRAAELGVTQETAGFIKAIADADTKVVSLGRSAAATNAILRQVPQQFTDIVVSLASGQQPLTVFLQQGGQLKDMFGSVGEAVRAMAGYIVGLINPLNVAAVAVGALAVAFFQGDKEAREFNKALILTGNQVGTTVSDLVQMRNALASTGATQGRAAEALLVFVNTAKVGRDNLEEFTAAALRFERAGGGAAEEVAKQFAELAREPLNAALKLNEAIGFLSFSTAEQIRLLEEQGNKTEAASVAQRAYAEYLNNATPQLVANLGYIERGWNAVKDAVKGAWNELLNLGRNDTADRLKSTLDDIARFEGQIARGLGSLVNKQELEALRARAAGYQALIQFDKNLAEQRSQTAREEDARVRARQESLAQENKYQDERTKKMREYRAEVDKAIANSRLLGESEDKLAARLKAIGEAFADKEKVTRRATAAAKDETNELNKLVGLNADYAKTLAAIVRERDAGNKSAEEANALIVALIEKQPFATKLAKDQAEAEKEIARNRQYIAAERDKYISAIDKEIEQIEKQILAAERERDALTMTREELAKVAAARRDEEAAMVKAEMSRLSLIPGMDAEIDRLREKYDAIIRLRDAELGTAGARSQADFSKALTSEVTKQAKDAQREWEKTSDQIERSLTESLMRGFESGKGFAENLRDTVVNMFKTMVLRPVISATMQPIAGSLTSAFIGGSSGGVGSSIISAIPGLGSLASAGGLAGLGQAFVAGGSLTAAEAAAASAAYSAAGMGGTATAISAGSALGPLAAAAPYIAAAAVAAMLLMGEGGGPKSGGQSIQQLTGGVSSTSILQTARAADGGRLLYTPATADAEVQKTVASIIASVTAQALKYGGKAGDFTVGLGYDLDPEGTASNRISSFLSTELGDILRNVNIDLGRDEAALKQGLSLEISRLAAAGLAASDLPQQIGDIFKSIDLASASQEQIDALFTAANAMDALLESATFLAVPLESVSDAMIAAAGGVEALTAGLGTYYQQFYTDEERRARGLSDLSKQFESLDLSLPSTREGFRALVESLDLTGEEGQKQYGALISLAGAFASLVPATEEAQVAISDLERAMMRNTRADLFERVGLVDEATAMRTQQMRNAFLLSGMGVPTSISALQDMVRAATPEQEVVLAEFADFLVETLTVNVGEGLDEVAAAAVTLEEALANLRNPMRSVEQIAQNIVALETTGKGLDIELLRAQGRTEEADIAQRALDTAGLTEAEIALYDYNQSVRDQIDAINTARRVQEEAAQEAARVAGERAGLERQLLELQGDTAAIRKLERDAISETNRDLYDRIVALRDEQTAQAENARQRQTIADQRTTLERELLEVTGDSAALRKLERDQIDASNLDLYDQIQARIELNAILEREKATYAERVGLEERLAAALGNSTAARERERDALDASNRSLFDRINTIADRASQASLFDALGLTADAQALRLTTLTDALREVGLAIPKTKDELLAIARTADPAQTAVLGTFAELLKTVVGGFEEAVPVVETLAKAITQSDLASLYERIGETELARTTRADLARTALAGVGLGLPTSEAELRTLVAGATAEQRQVIFEAIDLIFGSFTPAIEEAVARTITQSDLAGLYERVGATDTARSIRKELATAALASVGLGLPGTEAELLTLIRTATGEQQQIILESINDIYGSFAPAIEEAVQETVATLAGLDLANLYERVGLGDLAKSLRATTVATELGRLGLAVPTTTEELQNLVATLDGAQAAAILPFIDAMLSLVATTEEAVTALEKLDAQGIANLYRQVGLGDEADALFKALIGDALEQVGLVLPTTTAELQALVRAASPEQAAVIAKFAGELVDLTTVAETVSGGFQTLEEALAALRQGVERTVEDIARNIIALENQGQQLDVELLQAQGMNEEARALQRELDTAGLTPEEIAVYDANQAKRDRIEAIRQQAIADEEARRVAEQTANETRQRAEQAAKEAADRMRAIADERTRLEDRILALQGDTVALRAKELAALDPSNRALQERIWVLEREAEVASEREGLERQLLELQGDSTAMRAMEREALDESNRALYDQIQALKDKQAADAEIERQQQAILSEREGLERRLFELTASSEELRQAELDALDPSNRALLERIFALEDEKLATEEAAQAAEELRNAWADVTDTLAAEVDSLLGGIGSDQQSYAALQAKFAVATAQARAGDIEAAQSLTDLSRALLDAGTAQANSQLEVARIRAALADSLRTTSTFTSVFAEDPEVALPARPDWVNPDTDPAKVVGALEAMQADQQSQAFAIASLNARMVKLLERWDTDGLPQERIEA